jgi:ubiquinone/menaquinone biosynthesis C-methylase UbiE
MKTEKERWNLAAKEYALKVESKNSQGFLIREKCLNPYLFPALSNVKGKKILDYGCGDGWLAGELKQKGAEVKGCDISDKFIDIARKKHPGIEFKVIDEITPYADNEFDIVICNIVLHIIKNYQKVLDEIYRITKPDGEAIITIMHPAHYKAEIADLSKKEERLKIKVEETVPVVYYRRVPEIYEEAFDKTGFKITKKQECIAKEVISSELRKYSEKPFFLLYDIKKWVRYAASAVMRNKEGLVLMAKRAPTKFPFPNTWSIPSTSYTKEEDPKHVLKKVIKKKLGLDIEIVKEIGHKEGKQANYWLKMTDYEVLAKGIPMPNKEDYTETKYFDILKEYKDKPREKLGFCIQVALEYLNKKRFNQ